LDKNTDTQPYESLKQVWVLTAKFSLCPVPAHLLLVLYQRVVQLHSWADAGATSAATSTKTTRETDIVVRGERIWKRKWRLEGGSPGLVSGGVIVECGFAMLEVSWMAGAGDGPRTPFLIDVCFKIRHERCKKKDVEKKCRLNPPFPQDVGIKKKSESK